MSLSNVAVGTIGSKYQCPNDLLPKLMCSLQQWWDIDKLGLLEIQSLGYSARLMLVIIIIIVEVLIVQLGASLRSLYGKVIDYLAEYNYVIRTSCTRRI